MRTLNLGILAHVDAGKTSLTERLLYAAGVIDEVGSVDDGSTQTDTLALEHERGITLKSAVVSFVVDDVAINLIDTPGHPDFIAEVERMLGVLECDFDGTRYQPVEGKPPSRPRTDHNPLDREECLLRVTRRV
jgi:ribosomal protection tetracycline resistance protein